MGWLRAVGYGLVLLVLGACESVSFDSLFGEEPAKELPAAEGTTRPVKTARAQSDVSRSREASLPKPVEPQPPVTLRPEALVGMTQAQTQVLLGQPGDTLTIPPGTLWRYRSPVCVLELQFFLDVRTSQHRVATYEIAAREPGKTTAQACLNRIWREAHAGDRG